MLLKVRNVWMKVVEKIHILCPITLSSENPAVCELTWNNMVEPDRPQITI
jgi:hypothetical protein